MKLKLKFNFQPVPMIMTLVQLYFILLQYCWQPLEFKCFQHWHLW